MYMAVIYSSEQGDANVPFIVVQLPDVSAIDEQGINNMHRHHSPLTFALLSQQHQVLRFYIPLNTK